MLLCSTDDDGVAMDWKIIKTNGYKEIDGVRLDLSHLQDTTYRFSIEASAKFPQIDFNVLVQFSSHCISWGPKRDEIIDFDLHGHERRVIDDKGVHRCFCDARYELSSNLPGVFETLIDRQCLFTGHENWLTVEVLKSNGETEEYEVFFRITRQGSKMLRIYVESAYVREPEKAINKPVHLKRRDKVRAKVLLAKKLRGEPIRRPAGGRKRR